MTARLRHIIIILTVFGGLLANTVPLRAQVSDESDAVFSIVIPSARARSVDMGRLPIGAVRDTLIRHFARNTGRAAIRIDTIFVHGADAGAFSVTSGYSPVRVEQSAAHDAAFSFHPFSAGFKSAEIVMCTQVDTQRYVISGEAVEPLIRVEAEYVDFGAVPVGAVRDSVVETVVRNLAAGSVEIIATRQSGPDLEQFAVVDGNAPFTLSPFGTHTMTLRFAPRRGGRTSGSIRFTVQGSEQEPAAQLFGEGIGVRAEAVLATDTLSAAPGEIVHIPIRLCDARHLALSGTSSLRTELRFDASVLVPVGATPEGQIENGTRVIPLTDIPLLPLRDDILIELSFMAVLGDRTATVLELRNSVAVGGIAEIGERPGHFELTGICEEGGTRLFSSGGSLRLEQNRPNPFNAMTVVEFETIETAHTRLIVRDMHGRIVRVLFDGHAAPGVHRISFDAGDLVSGTYLYELRSGGLHIRRRMQLVK